MIRQEFMLVAGIGEDVPCGMDIMSRNGVIINTQTKAVYFAGDDWSKPTSQVQFKIKQQITMPKHSIRNHLPSSSKIFDIK